CFTLLQLVLSSILILAPLFAYAHKAVPLNLKLNPLENLRIVTGTVVDTNGEAIPGVAVVIQGGRVGTVTDVDGKYSINVPDDQTVLVFSSIGYVQREIVVGTESVINVTLEAATSSLDEVVVTALGVKRDRKALTYATQQIGSQELTVAANTNFMDAFNGKAAGIDIKVSGSGAGGSTKAVLRGNKSLQGLSEALYVIDGIPLVNNKGPQPGSYGGTDGGDGLSSINPADIESISILRGANAAILYGSQGANGVILITTKKGKEGRTSVELNSSTVLEQVSGLPDFQYRYGTVGGDYSWTPPGMEIVKSDNYQKDYIEDFFRTGVTATNSVAISGGNNKTTAYFSYANISAKGVVPTNTYHKNNFSFNQSTKLWSDKVTVSSNVIFSVEKSHNRPGAGYYNNPLTGLFLFARDRDFNAYKNNYAILDEARNMERMNWYSTEEKQNNPYWELNKNSKDASSKRAIANMKVGWDILDNLRVEVRGNIDYNIDERDFRYAAGGNSVSVSPNGTWNYVKHNDQSIYTDGILTYNETWGD